MLTPRLVGERIGLHPLAVIFALLAFGQLFGFVGVLLALPLSAVISVALRRLRHAWLASDFYRHDDAAARSSTCAPEHAADASTTSSRAATRMRRRCGEIAARRPRSASSTSGAAPGSGKPPAARDGAGGSAGRAPDRLRAPDAPFAFDAARRCTWSTTRNRLTTAPPARRFPPVQPGPRRAGRALVAAGDAPAAGLAVREDLRTRLGWGLISPAPADRRRQDRRAEHLGRRARASLSPPTCCLPADPSLARHPRAAPSCSTRSTPRVRNANARSRWRCCASLLQTGRRNSGGARTPGLIKSPQMPCT